MPKASPKSLLPRSLLPSGRVSLLHAGTGTEQVSKYHLMGGRMHQPNVKPGQSPARRRMWSSYFPHPITPASHSPACSEPWDQPTWAWICGSRPLIHSAVGDAEMENSRSLGASLGSQTLQGSAYQKQTQDGTERYPWDVATSNQDQQRFGHWPIKWACVPLYGTGGAMKEEQKSLSPRLPQVSDVIWSCYLPRFPDESQ